VLGALGGSGSAGADPDAYLLEICGVNALLLNESAALFTLSAFRECRELGTAPRLRLVSKADLLARQFNCPPTTAGGRWFDAAAAALGLHTGPQAEAEAAVALERAAAEWLADQPADAERPAAAEPLPLDQLPALVASLFDLPAVRRGEGAARFHIGLASALAQATLQQAAALDVGTVVLGGGCFFNRVLSQALTRRLEAAGLRVLRPSAPGCGDAGLALGQAWLASWATARGDAGHALSHPASASASSSISRPHAALET
jgi:hydrogenase maturation protein HypF